MKRSLLTMMFAILVGVGAFGGVAARQAESTPESTPLAGHDHGDHSHDHGDGADLSMGAAYLMITNNGDDADRLVSVSTDVAEVVEIHEVTMTDNVMEMSPLHDGLEIPAGESVSLEPGGYHIMLIGLTKSLIAGEDYELTLSFEHAGEVTVTVPIFRTEPKDDEATGEKVEADDLEIGSIWSRQAPKIDAGVATPTASPEATPEH